MRFKAPLAIVAGAIALRLAIGVGFVNYDTLYSLVWGQQLAAGENPELQLPARADAPPAARAARPDARPARRRRDAGGRRRARLRLRSRRSATSPSASAATGSPGPSAWQPRRSCSAATRSSATARAPTPTSPTSRSCSRRSRSRHGGRGPAGRCSRCSTWRACCARRRGCSPASTGCICGRTRAPRERVALAGLVVLPPLLWVTLGPPDHRQRAVVADAHPGDGPDAPPHDRPGERPLHRRPPARRGARPRRRFRCARRRRARALADPPARPPRRRREPDRGARAGPRRLLGSADPGPLRLPDRRARRCLRRRGAVRLALTGARAPPSAPLASHRGAHRRRRPRHQRDLAGPALPQDVRRPPRPPIGRSTPSSASPTTSGSWSRAARSPPPACRSASPTPRRSHSSRSSSTPARPTSSSDRSRRGTYLAATTAAVYRQYQLDPHERPTRHGGPPTGFRQLARNRSWTVYQEAVVENARGSSPEHLQMTVHPPSRPERSVAPPLRAPARETPAAPTGTRLRLLPSGSDLVRGPTSRGPLSINTPADGARRATRPSGGNSTSLERIASTGHR